jgi:2-amino-4-hydroxy-6-hydroxymethyldihydropteridine diphosphokinase
MKIAALLLGSNVGDRPGYLLLANEKIGKAAGKITSVSNLYETAPWGITDQRSFLNQAILLETELEPRGLLDVLLDIEMQLGRERREKWGPRIIDIDILYYDNRIVNEAHLTIPHPFLPERRFSLMPLNEITPQWIHPGIQKSVSQMLEECTDQGEVVLYNDDIEE